MGDDEKTAQGGSGSGSAKQRRVHDPSFRPTSKDTIVSDATGEYLSMVSANPALTLAEVRDGMLRHINNAIATEAKLRHKAVANAPAITTIDSLDELSVVRALLARRRIVAVALSDDTDADTVVLASYQDIGEHEGLYLVADGPLARLVAELKPSLTGRMTESVLKLLATHAPTVARTRDPNLIPVANGVFDHAKQELLPFSPDYVFLTKSPVAYDPDAQSPVILNPDDGTSWELEEWMADLSDDEGVPELLWEVVSATLRPDVRWDKAAFLHSSRGNNGKGTYCQLLRELVGPAGHASIPIASFSKPFALTALTHARAIITDENGVGAFAQDLSDFKSVVTGDAFMLDRKHKDPITARFSGMVVQCVNDFPKSRDKSASYTRRQLFVPFRKWFGGAERKYIKKDYLKRDDVLRYALRRALQMQHDELSEPAACAALLEQFQRENNPVRDFWTEVEDELVWDLLPTAFLYDLFLGWFRKTHPSGTPMNRNEFSNQLEDILAGDTRWDYSDPRKKHRIKKMMAKPEPLIAVYEAKAWYNTVAKPNDPISIGSFNNPSPNYRGVLRRQVVNGAPASPLVAHAALPATPPATPPAALPFDEQPSATDDTESGENE